MKRISGILIRWILCLLLICGLLYAIDGLNMWLLWNDIYNGFKDNRNFLLKAMIFLIIFSGGCIIYECSRMIRYYWKIHIFRMDISVLVRRSVKADVVVGILLVMLNILVYSILSIRSIQPDRSWMDYVYIAHALGEVGGIDYSNCKEALEYSYELGYKVYEVDLSLTSDGRLACTHAWEVGLQPEFNPDNRPTAEEFLNVPIGEMYTPILFSDLCNYMTEHPEIYVVTDSKEIEASGIREEFNSLVEEAKALRKEECLDRIIVQIYTDEMYEVVREVYPFSHYIYTLYMAWDVCADDAEEQLVHFCRFVLEHNLDGITLSYQYSDKGNFMDILKRYPIPYFFHTVNDMEVARQLLEDGAKGIYTDNLLIQMKEKEQ